MKPETAEWTSKAEKDWTSANREYRARKAPNYDSACFHAQQCIEKYLKALLVERGRTFPKTHDLAALALRLHPEDGQLADFAEELAMLTVYAVAIRYPGNEAEKPEAKEAVIAAKKLRTYLRSELGIADEN